MAIQSKFNRRVVVFGLCLLLAVGIGTLLDSTMIPSVFAVSSGPNNGSTFDGSTDATCLLSSTGTLNWGNPSNAQTSNNAYATVTTSTNLAYTKVLKVTGFSFSIPSTATIDGIQVDFEVKGSASDWSAVYGNGAGACMIKGGSYVGTRTSATGLLWSTSDTYLTIGGATDLLGTSWTSSNVNGATFGVGLIAEHVSSSSTTASVDHVRITIYYTNPVVVVNAKVVAADGTTALSSAQVTINNGTDQAKTVTCGTSCWANYTGITATSVTLKVKWENSWVNGTFTLATTTNQTITIVTKVYQTFTLAWRFNDNSTAFTPTQAQISAPNGSLVTVTSYTLGKVQNGTWTIRQIKYGVDNVVPDPNPTFTPTGDSQTRQIKSRVYSIAITNSIFKDNGGSALYKAPSAFTITTPNSTSITSVGTYWIQNGTNSMLTVVTWEGISVVPTSNTFDASNGVPSFNLKVYSIAFSFKRSDGSALSPSIQNYTITSPNNTVASGRTASSYAQVPTGTITLTYVYWENSNVMSTSNTYSLTTSSTWTVTLRIYSITPSWKDAGGTVLYANPTFKWTAPNGTLSGTLAGGTAYWLQNGTATISQITWKGTANMIIISGSSFDAASGSPTVLISVYALTLNAVDQSSLAINVTFTITFPNSTQTSFASNTTGYKVFSQVQNGTYSITTTWLSLQVAGPTSFNITTTNKQQAVSALVYFTAVNSFRSAVDQGTLSTISGTADTILFTASASGNHSVKVYVGSKGTPQSVWVDSTKLTSGQWSYDVVELTVTIPLTFSTHDVAMLWIAGGLPGPQGGGGASGGGGPLNVLGPVAEVAKQIIEAAKGNPWIVGLIIMGGLYGGSYLSYREEHERVAIFLLGMGIFFTFDAMFFWNILPKTALQTNLGFLPLTLDKLLFPLPSLELPTVLPTGEDLARGFLSLMLISLPLTVVAYVSVRD